MARNFFFKKVASLRLAQKSFYTNQGDNKFALHTVQVPQAVVLDHGVHPIQAVAPPYSP